MKRFFGTVKLTDQWVSNIVVSFVWNKINKATFYCCKFMMNKGESHSIGRRIVFDLKLTFEWDASAQFINIFKQWVSKGETINDNNILDIHIYRWEWLRLKRQFCLSLKRFAQFTWQKSRKQNIHHFTPQSVLKIKVWMCPYQNTFETFTSSRFSIKAFCYPHWLAR